MAFYQRDDVAVVRSYNQVAFPVAWNSTVLNLWWARTDWDCIFDLAQLKTLLGGMPGPPDGAGTAQAFLQFLLQNPTGLNIKTTVDRFMRHAVLLFIRVLPFEPTGDLFRRPLQTQLPRDPMAQGRVERELTRFGPLCAVPSTLI